MVAQRRGPALAAAVGVAGVVVVMVSVLSIAEGFKATLTTAGRGRLDGVVTMLRSRFAGLGVRVYGYTDSDPIKHSRKLWTDNLDLSANRAMAVTRYLRSKGLSAESIETVAMGATNPISSNSSATGKSKNRRVVIKVVRK